MTEIEYQVLFPVVKANFMGTEFTFSIHNMKSRAVSSVYFIVHFYNNSNTEIYSYKSPRWVVDNTYSSYHNTFNIAESILNSTTSYQIELRAVNITSENPLWFNKVMFKEGDYDEAYHVPDELHTSDEIKFNKSRYTNLYNKTGEYLQIIRPNGDNIFTDRITASKCTVIAPHLVGETSIDSPVNLFLEYYNQTDQRIDVLR